MGMEKVGLFLWGVCCGVVKRKCNFRSAEGWWSGNAISA